MSIDLHVHSVNSDGTDSTEAIIESSIELQLEAICISDHEYLTKVPQQNNIEIIQGVEISVSWDLLDDTNKFGGTHLLVYFLNCLLYTSDAADERSCRSRWSPYH